MTIVGSILIMTRGEVCVIFNVVAILLCWLTRGNENKLDNAGC
jgi:hypothetical protein